MRSCGGSIQTTVHDLNDLTLGQCALFEEKQVNQRHALFANFSLFYISSFIRYPIFTSIIYRLVVNVIIFSLEYRRESPARLFSEVAPNR